MADRPDRPVGAPNDIIDRLRSQSPGMLRELAQFSLDLADYKAAEHDQDQDDDLDDREDLRDPVDVEGVDASDAPAAGAYVNEKEIDQNVYLYWQWRDGDKIRSEYIKPKNPKQKPKGK